MGCGSSQVSETGPSRPHHQQNGHGPSHAGHRQPPEPAPYREPSPEPGPYREPTPEREPYREPTPEPEPYREPTPEPEPYKERSPGPEPPRDPTPEPAREPSPQVSPMDPDVPNDGKEDSGRIWRKPLVSGESVHEAETVDNYRLTDLGAKGSQFRMGRITVTIDTRASPTDDSDVRPHVTPGSLWEDPDFSLSQAMEGEEGVEFRRPKDLCDNPALYTQGTTRFDIVQGKVGSCYFLSIIASLADKPDFLKQVIPEGEYDLDSDAYDGVFRVRFWRFGKWVDMFVDDRIPVRQTEDGVQPWGARSCDPREMWVSLVEKAFAKFHGSYKSVFGGLAGDAFLTLTGGVAENIKHDQDIGKISHFFNRVSNALHGGSLVSSSVPDSKDGVHGLVGGHAYTVTGAGQVGYRERTLSLLRVRNPWGKETGEWTGPWSDGADQWTEVSDEAKAALDVQGRGDGEFWMTLDDFLCHFVHTYICNFTPDFDRDGIDDGLENVCSIIGEWKGSTTAGSDAETKFNNPKYELRVPDKVGPEGTTPVVIQCLQKKQQRLNSQFQYVRVDLYKTDARLDSGQVVYDEITNYLSYQGGQEVCYRYSLAPGTYLILPTTLEAGQEQEFLIRTFSSISLSCSEIKSAERSIVRKCDMEFVCNDQTYHTDKMTYASGSWVKGKNAGGQISKPTFHTNPQYHITVQGADPVPLTVLLMQDVAGEQLAVGWKLWKGDAVSPPLDAATISRVYNDSVPTVEGEGIFVFSYEAEGSYLLPPGQYTLLVFTDGDGDQKDFVLCLGTSSHCQLKYRPYNT